MEHKSIETLFSGRTVEVLHLDGSKETIKVRQILIGQYPKAYGLMDDEFALTAYCCCDPEDDSAVKDVAWLTTLRPESYEQLQAAAREVNEKGFFSYASRQRKAVQEANAQMFANMAELPPEFLKMAIDLGSKADQRFVPPSPRPPRR